MNNKRDKMIQDPTVPGGYRWNEAETRRRLLNVGKYYKIEKDVEAILAKYDRAFLRCTNSSEKKMIAEMAASEIQKLFGGRDELTVSGKKII